MKFQYVRGLWGKLTYDFKCDISNRRQYYVSLGRSKVENDIKLNFLSPYTPEYTVYCFGNDNYKYMQDLGLKSVLIDSRDYIWDMNTEWWRHKIEVLKYAMMEHEPIIYLDWDCVAVRKIPDNIWDVLAKKAPIQSPLKMYVRNEAHWRPHGQQRAVIDGCFVYIRNKEIVDGIIKTWETTGPKWLDEATIAKYIDDTYGGWKGIDNYFEHFEPSFPIHRDHLIQSNNFEISGKHFFEHVTYRSTRSIIKNIKERGKKWEDYFPA